MPTTLQVTREQYMDLIESGCSSTTSPLTGESKAILRAHALRATKVRVGSYLIEPCCPATQAGLFDRVRGISTDPNIGSFACRFDDAVRVLAQKDPGNDVPLRVDLLVIR